MAEEIVTKRLTHRRIETPTEIKIEVNTLYRTALLVFVVVTFAGFFFERDWVLSLGIFLLVAQWLYSLIYWNPVFREIKKATAEKRVTTSGDKRSIDHPFTYTIQRGSKVVLNDDTLDS